MMSYSQAMAQPMLSHKEELELIAAWQERGDVAARDRIICTHVRLCYAVATRYDNNREHIRDLAQEGVFGLSRAVDKFEPKHGTRFATYARYWIMTFISQAIGKVATVVDLSPRLYLDARGSGIDDEELPWQARQAARGEIPLDTPVGEDGDTALVDLIKCPRPTPEAAAIEADRIRLFKGAVADGIKNAMTEREAEVVRRRLLCDKAETLDEIARDLGVSRERIRQIEVNATGKLRRHLTKRGFPVHLLRA